MSAPAVDCVLDIKARTGEGIVWSMAEQLLYWVDIPAPTLNRFDPASGVNEVFAMPAPIGCFALRERGGIVAALASGWHSFDTEDQELVFWSDPEADKPGNRFNDGTTDPAGRFFAGTMPIAGPEEAPEGSLYRLDPDRTTTRIEGGYWVQNGLAFSPDGRTMYVSDSYPAVRTIWACDYDVEDAAMTNRRVFFETEGQVAGRPDGGTIDADGCYWMAGVGGWQLVRITPDGKLDRIIDMPVEKPTKIAFGGPDLGTMYVTSIGTGLAAGTEARQPRAGGIFALDAGVKGVPTPPYRG